MNARTTCGGARGHRLRWPWWVAGVASFVWLALRSGTDPRRLSYPCQRAALASGSAALGWLLTVAGGGALYGVVRRRTAMGRVAAGALTAVLLLSLAGSSPRSSAEWRESSPPLPAWTSPTAVSDVFVVGDVPPPECSLDGGVLPSVPPCNVPAHALRDPGVDALVAEMEGRGDHFFETAAHPQGVVGSDDVVVIKINNQWGLNGDPDVQGRLSTNTDVLKGLIWRILQHPDGFSGEVVVAENTQGSGAQFDTEPANSQDRNQSLRDVVNAFAGLGYPVWEADWNPLNWNLISGGPVIMAGIPLGEYAHGNMEDAYILLEDPDGVGVDELAYPKFQTAAGTYVSLRYGVWSGGAYHPDRLTLINLPVLKAHGMAGATIAWKNLIGFGTTSDTERRYGGSDPWSGMHDFYWGYTGSTDPDYGLLGRLMALVRAPDLSLVDAIWVADDNYWASNVTRQDVLLASTDPFAVDWYASEVVLHPTVGFWQHVSAARAGTFRSASRVNQNVAAAWWIGPYPWIDLFDWYDGDVPSDEERAQMNVYVAGGAIFADGFETGSTALWSVTAP